MLSVFNRVENIGGKRENACYNFNIAILVHFFCDRKENIVGKGGIAGYQHFLLFPQCFKKSMLKNLHSVIKKRIKFCSVYIYYI